MNLKQIQVNFDEEDVTLDEKNNDLLFLKSYSLQSSVFQREQHLSSTTFKPQKKHPTNHQKKVKFSSLKFSSKYSQQKGLYISHSGLTVTCTTLNGSYYAIGNKVWNKGIHVFQLQFPLGTEGIDFGIIQNGFSFNQANQMSYLVSFKFFSSKKVIVKVDLIQQCMKIWLDGVYQPQKSMKIQKGEYMLCVKLQQRGNICILNPFCEDPERQSEIQKREQIQYEIKNEQEEEQSIEQQDKATKQEIIYNKQSDNLIILKGKKLKLIKRNPQGAFDIDYFAFKNKVKQIQNIVNLQIDSYEENLIRNEPFLQPLAPLLKEKPIKHLQMKFGQGRALISNLFKEIIEKIQKLEENILGKQQIQIEEKANSKPEEETNLVHKVSCINDELPFFYIQESEDLQQQAINEEQQKKKENVILIPNNSLLNNESKISNEQQQEKQESFEDFAKNTKIQKEAMWEIASLLAKLDEALHQIGQNEEIPQQSFRIHTSFGRLESFLSFNNTLFTVEELSESGILNIGDFKGQYVHFLDKEVPLQIQNNENLSEQLEKQIPFNRMVNNLFSCNVPLYISINNMPYQKHFNGNNNKVEFVSFIKKVFGKRNSSFISTISNDGIVNIWNTQTLLINAGWSSLRKVQEQPEKWKIILENIQAKELQNGGNSNNNYFNAYSQIYKILESCISEECRNTKKPTKTTSESTQQSQSEANKNLIEQLLTLGFSINVATKACLQVKNENIDKAIDAAFTIKEEEQEELKLLEQTTQGKNQQEITVGSIKPIWDCEMCTFENSAPAQVCEICLNKAPEYAFYSAEEVEELERERKEIKEREEREQKEKQKQKEREEEQRKQREEQQRRDQQQKKEENNKRISEFLQNAKLGTCFQLNTGNSFKPIFIGAVFQNNNKSVIKIKQFGHNPDYLKSFYSVIDEDFLINNITGESLKGISEENVHKLLFENSSHSQYVIQFLMHYFSNQEQGGNLLEVAGEDLDIEIENDEIQDIEIIENNGIFNIYLQGTQQKVYLYQLVQYSFNNFEVKFINQINANGKIFTINNEVQFLQNNGDVQDNQGKIVHQRFLQQQIDTFNPLSNSQVAAFSQKNKSIYLIEKQGESQKRLLQQKYIGSFIENNKSLHSSHLDISTQLNSRHQIVLQSEKEALFSFKESQKVSQIDIQIQTYEPFWKNEKLINTQKQEFKLEMEEQNLYLPIKVAFYTNSSYSPNTLASSCVFPSNSFFQGYQKRPLVLLEHIHGEYMYVERVKVSTLSFPQSGAYPFQNAAIFTCNSIQVANMIEEMFGNMEYEDYQKWRENKKNLQEPIEEWEPVGFAHFGENESEKNILLEHKRTCKYVIVIATTIKKEFKHIAEFSQIAYKFLAIQGFIVDGENQKHQDSKNYDSNAIELQNILQLNFLNENNQWNQLGQLSLNEIHIHQQENFVHKSKQTAKVIENINKFQQISNQESKPLYIVSLKISSQQLNNQQIKQIKLKALKNFNNLTVCYLSDQVNLKNKLLAQNYNDFNLQKYIEETVLNCKFNEFQQIYVIFKHLNKQNNFQSNLLQAILQVLPKLKQGVIQVSNKGIQIFLSLLKYILSVDKDAIFNSLLKEMHEIALLVKNKRNEKYNILVSQYGISSLCFEKQGLYTLDFFKNKVNKQINHQFERKNGEIIEYKFQVEKKQQFINKVVIDLQGNYTLAQEIMVYCTKKDYQYPHVRFQMWFLNERNEEILITDNQYDNDFITQISKFSYEKECEQNFENYQDLKYFKVPFTQGKQFRYVIIQQTYAYLPFLGSIFEQKSDEVLLWPVFIGTKQQSQQNNNANQIFNLNNQSKEKKQIQINFFNSYIEYEDTSQNSYQGQFLVTDKPQNIEKNAKILQELQQKLNKEQEKLENVLEKNQKKDENAEERIKEQVTQIENLQVEIYNLQRQPHQGDLSYLYYLMQRFSQFLRTIHGKNANSQSIKNIFYDIFDVFVVHENNMLSQETLSLLSEVLIDNLSEREWLKFVLQILKKYLMIPSTSLSFSQSNLISALDKISIPLGEVLSYLAQQLNINISENDDNNQVVQEQNDNIACFACIAPTLQLLNHGMKNIINNINNISQQQLKLSKSVSRELERIQQNQQSEQLPVPLGIKRSISHPIKKGETQAVQKNQVSVQSLVLSCIDENDDDDDLTAEFYKRLNFEQSFGVGFQVLLWICNNANKFNVIEFGLLVQDCCLLLELTLKLTCAKSVKKTLINNSCENGAFFKVFFTILHSGDTNAIAIFAKLIKTLANSQEYREVEKKQRLQQIQLIIIYQLEQILTWILEHPTKGQNIYSQNNVFLSQNEEQKIKAELWQKHIELVLDLLLQCIKCAQIEFQNQRKNSIKQKNVLPPLIHVQRSLSVPLKQQHQITYTIQQMKEFIQKSIYERQCLLQINILLNLLQYLQPKEQESDQYVLFQLSNIWNLTFQLIQGYKMKEIISSNIIEKLSKLFFSYDQQKNIFFQQILIQKCSDFLNFIQNLLQQISSQVYSKQISQILFNIIFDIFNTGDPNVVFSPESIHFFIIQGWLDILLTSQTPKPESYYIKPLEKAFCTLSITGGVELLDNVCKYLMKSCNVGGFRGALMSDQKTLLKLQLIHNILNIIMLTETHPSQGLLNEIFVQSGQNIDSGLRQKVENAFQNLILWLIFNKINSGGTVSPSLNCLQQINQILWNIFNIIGKNVQITKVFLKQLINTCMKLDVAFANLIASEWSFRSVSVNQFNQNASQMLEKIFDMFVFSDEIASYLAFDINAFDFLLEKIGLNNKMNDKNGQLMIEGQDLSQIPLVAEEQITNAKYIKQMNTSNWNVLQQQNINWTQSKNGVCDIHLMWIQMSGKQNYECSLIIELQKEITVSQIRIGFNTFWSEQSDKVLGVPSCVFLEYSIDSATQFIPLTQLVMYEDFGYESFGIKVCGKNFERLQSNLGCEEIEKILQSAQLVKAKYLKFRFIRPSLTFLENGSILQSKMYQNVAISISFISVLGKEINQNIESQTRNQIILEQERSALKLISKICNKSFMETLNKIAHNEKILNKIKIHFETLSTLLLNNSQNLSPVFIAIASNNQNMGDWILSKFLNLNKNNQHAKMGLEIIQSQVTNLHQRLLTLHNFVLNDALVQILSEKQSKASLLLNSFIPFVETYTTCIQTSAYDLLETNQKYELPLSTSNIDNIIQLFVSFYEFSKQKNLIKLLNCILNLPSPFVSSNNLLKYALDKVWNLAQENSNIYELLSPVILCKREGVKWLIEEENQKKLLLTVAKLMNIIKNNQNQNNNQDLLNLMQFFRNLTQDVEIQNAIGQSKQHINIYNALKNSKGKQNVIIKDFQNEVILELIVDSLKNVAMSSPQQTKMFAQILCEDVSLLSDKKDMVFVTSLLVPLLNAEKKTPLCFQPYDSVGKKWLLDARKILDYKQIVCEKKLSETTYINLLQNNQTQEKNINGKDSNQLISSLSTTLLNENLKKVFFKNFTKFNSSVNQLFTKFQQNNYKWQLALSQTKDGDQQILKEVREKVLSNSPFLVIMQGKNAGKNCVVGAYSTINVNEDVEEYDYEKSYQIPASEESFLFYYEDQFQMHFDCSKPSNLVFGQLIYTEEVYGGLTFQQNNTERIFISYQNSQKSILDINLQDMQPIDENTDNFPDDISTDFALQKVEYWILKSDNNQNNNKNVMNKATSSQIQQRIFSEYLQTQVNMLLPPHMIDISHYSNYYRSVPVFNVPCNLDFVSVLNMVNVNNQRLQEKGKNTNSLQFRLRHCKDFDLFSQKNVKINDLQQKICNQENSNGIIDIEYDALSLFENLENNENNEVAQYMPFMPIFDAFNEQGGVQQIISVISSLLQTWKNQKAAQKWDLYIKELNIFSKLPNFFALFMKNKDRVELLFQLLASLPDDGVSDTQVGGGLQLQQEETNKKQKNNNIAVGGSKKWDEEEQKAVNSSYQVLKETFKLLGVENNMRELAIESGVIICILDKIAIVSKEIKRYYKEDAVIEEVEIQQPQVQQQQEEDDGKKKIQQKKGIGYGSDNTGQNQKWNTNEYIESKKQRSEQLLNIISILEAFLDFKDWVPPKKLLDQILQSALLPLIESALRSGSLLEMSKESELVQSYLSLIRVMAKNQCLIPCLLPIDPHYIPKQVESVLQLLTNLKNTAMIFISCLKQTDEQQSKTNDDSKKLADQIIQVYNLVNDACQEYQKDHEDDFEEQNQQEQINEILKLALPQKYKLLLQDLRFDYVSVKDQNGKYKHHYSANITQQYTPSQAKMVRLAQELADLSTALPIDHTNSIFVRCDKDRVDVMKCLVMGSKGTPYAHGAFLFDVFFGDDYPQGPPKCNLETTGAGKVRFNPNLYACGKVCLSLLGTWRGNASENWDPKISTLLQILVSLQAIIMSEEVYFNEPGFEGEAGTPEGENKNEAYSNIVRYCNIKFAMIDQIKNPPEGFEAIISRHFYLKKDEILQECQKWIKYSEVRTASYSGLVNDHNSSWCAEFKTKYSDMLKNAVKELEEVLNKIPPPSVADTKIKLKGAFLKKKKKDNQGQIDIKQGVAKLDEIDMTYEELQQKDEQVLDINDEKVKDRWSRYIGAMGIDAVAKQSKCSIFLSGLNALGVEIAKNIVLSGVKRLTVHDQKNTSFVDLAGQFYLTEEDVGKNRAEACLNKLKQLNHYVKIDTALLGKELPTKEEEIEQILKMKEYDLVILIEQDIQKLIVLNNFCRKNKIKFICADVEGPFCRLFNDFGDTFEVIDKNGEDPTEVMIKNISIGEKGIVTLLQGVKHPYEDGEHVIINEVEGMERINKEMNTGNSINGTIHKVKVINSNSFEIGDTRIFTNYVRNGLAKNIKTPVNIQFKSLEEIWSKKSFKDGIQFDQSLYYYDFEKINNAKILFVAWKTLEAFKKENKQNPSPWNQEDVCKFLLISQPIIKDMFVEEDVPKEINDVLVKFVVSNQGNFGPLAAFLGGFVTQEIVKAITNKYIPTNQLFFADCLEVLPSIDSTNYQDFIKNNYEKEFLPQKSRLDGIRYVLGESLLKKLQNCNLFMVGCGAIGCELLKNFAMINLCTGQQGQLTITDPDHIETSNLNRQFLFREKHLRKPKSQTAAAAIIQMNPLLKNHIYARLDKVCDQTVNIFSDKFFQSLSLVANALDNIQARKYVDSRCVTNKIPLLESGTLGPKGHVQVIIPFQTESYGSQQDPVEEGEIPHCTLKMFPEETLHCIEWARDKFGKLFSLRPKVAVKILDDTTFDPNSNQEMKELHEAITLLEKRPKNFEDCMHYALRKFYKYYRNDIRQLIYTYPLNSKTKDGEPFWKLPKRPPTEITQFDPNNELHSTFVTSLAVLRAKVFNIDYPKDFRNHKMRVDIAINAAKNFKIPDFIPSDEKAKSITSQVDKTQQQQTEEQEETKDNNKNEEKTQLIQKLQQLRTLVSSKTIVPQEFEKDEDENGQIDLIYSMANCRTTNYKLVYMDWLQVKLKAGKIVPALATTTATIAGLQTIELVKVLKQEKLVNMKNAFLNLAVPVINLTEPQKPEKYKIHDDLSITLWDRWEVKLGKDVTLQQIFDYILKTYQLHVSDIMDGAKLVYSHIASKANEKNMKLIDKLDTDDNYADLIFTFTDLNGNNIKKAPIVRVIFE